MNRYLMLLTAIVVFSACSKEKRGTDNESNDLIFLASLTSTYNTEECKPLLQMNTTSYGFVLDSVTYQYNKNRVVKRHYTNSELYIVDSVWNNNNVRKTKITDVMNRSGWTTYEYFDDYQNVIKIIKIIEEESDTIRMNYDSLNNLIEVYYNDKLSSTYKYDYENGKAKQKKSYNPNTGLSKVNEKYYYANGKLIKKEILNSINEVYEYETYEYNDWSCLVKTNYFGPKSEP